MRIICLSVLLCLSVFSALAQVQTLEVGAPGSVGGNYGSVRYYDPSTVGQKNAAVSYADISGSPFWEDKWKPAFLYLGTGLVVKLKSVKLNLYSNDVHYLDKEGTELAAAAGSVQKVVFLSEKDSNRITAVFEAFADLTDKSRIAYYKILNNGKFRLLEMKRSYVHTSPYDPLQGKSISSFFSKSNYAITDSSTTLSLKSLGANTILPFIYPDNGFEQWLKQTGNKMNSEKEVIAFLDHVNAGKK